MKLLDGRNSISDSLISLREASLLPPPRSVDIHVNYNNLIDSDLFFYTEMGGACNALPGMVIADMIVVFERLLERYMDIQGTESFVKNIFFFL